MADEENDNRYHIEKIPLSIFTDGLDFEQERTLLTIQEAMGRGSAYAKAMADGNEEVIHEFKPLYRLLHGITAASIIPIMKLIEDNVDPHTAVMAVMGGVGAMFFFGGIEYAKAMGLDGVGVDLPEKANGETEEDPNTNFYPEGKPQTLGDMPESLGLDALLQRFQEQNPELEDEE